MDAHLRASKAGRFVDRFVSFISGEWILTWTPHTANGGTVVAARTLWLTAWVYLPAFLLFTTLSEGRVAELDLRQGAADFVTTLPWLAAIFTVIYAGLYTRFSSQWTYLANLFNQIVQTEVSMPLDERDLRDARLAAWKAGFIEDAEDLHLATKPLFLMAVRTWAQNEAVATAYAGNTVGGADRLTQLVQRLDQIVERSQPQQPVGKPAVELPPAASQPDVASQSPTL